MSPLAAYEWFSYSCNNSSDYRLVAKFDSPKRASEMRKELTSFFSKHAKEYDEATNLDTFEWPGEPTKVAHKLGQKYEHKWSEFLIWGEEQLSGDEPFVMALDDTLVLYHNYSSGGFGPDVPAILKRAGATLPEKGAMASAPIFRVEFDLPAGAKGSELEAELYEFFEQRHTVEYKCDWQLANAATDYAWGEGDGDAEDVTFWIKDGHCCFTYSMRPDYFDNMKKYLKSKKVKNLSMRFASKVDVKANAKIDKQLAKLREKASVKSAGKAPRFDPSGRSFLFTGKLAAMSRADAEGRTKAIGGKTAKSVTKDLDVLVVGDEGSPLFGAGSKGAKLLKAESLNQAGASIRIISETEFLTLGSPSTPKQAAAKKSVAKKVAAKK